MVELNMMPSFLMPGGRWAYSSQKYTSGPPITSSPITLSIGIGYAAARSLNSATSARRSPTPNAVSAAFCSGDASCAGLSPRAIELNTGIEAMRSAGYQSGREGDP